MTISENINFRCLDTMKYELQLNREFLDWLKISIDEGYHSFINIEELQDLINNMTCWYEIKYPEREFYTSIGKVGTDFQDIRKLSDVMDMKQLLYRLSYKQLYLIQCGYRANGFGVQTIYKDGKEVDEKPVVFMNITKKEDIFNYFLLSADILTGEVLKDANIEKYLHSKENVTLDELLDILKGYPDVDITKLEACVNCHNRDLELRHRILQLVPLKLLYSKNTIPEIGYERAKRFIDEFNQYLGLTLSTSEIDEIMSKDYKNEKVIFQKKRKKIFYRKK